MFKEEKKEKVQKTKSRQEAWRASSKKSKGQSQDLQTTTVTDLHVGIDMRFCRSTFHPEDSSKSNLDVLKSHNLKKLQKRSLNI